MRGNSPARWLFLLGVLAAPPAPAGAAQPAVRLGLDHIPVVVSDLERAGAAFRRLGFALKPGRHHASGIRNTHVKFPDGAGVELLTAATAVDALSAHYVDLLRGGEGPAFVSFHARDTGRLHSALREGGYEFRHDGAITELRSPDLAYLFVVRDNRSPTDRPEHFAHANGATALDAVWVAPHDGEALARLLVHLGGRRQRREVLAPDPVEATVVALAGGEVFILPRRHQLLPGRPVIGASFTVPDLAGVRRTLAEARITPRAGNGAAERVVVGPGNSHGLWLEFRRNRETPSY
jgi:hypothetical protein